MTEQREQLRAKVDAAFGVIARLCDGSQRWTMSIPARENEDPDLVIAAALTAQAKEIERLSALSSSEQWVAVEEREERQRVFGNAASNYAIAHRLLDLDPRADAIVAEAYRDLLVAALALAAAHPLSARQDPNKEGDR